MGSKREAGKGTSRLLSAWMTEAVQLSSDDSDTLQAASSNMVGMTVSSGYPDKGGIAMGVVALARKGNNAALAEVDIRFDGDEAC